MYNTLQLSTFLIITVIYLDCFSACAHIVSYVFHSCSSSLVFAIAVLPPLWDKQRFILCYITLEVIFQFTASGGFDFRGETFAGFHFIL